MKLAHGRRRGVASVIGTIFFLLVLMAAIGVQAYMSSLQTQSAQAVQQAQSVAAQKAEEVLLYSTPSSGLTVSDSGPTTSKVVAMILKFPNGTVYSLPVSVALPASTSAVVQPIVPGGVCSPGTATCLSKYNSIVNNAVSGESVGLVTSLGNSFWYVPSTSLVQWSSLTNLPSGCTEGQYVTGVGSAVTCSKVGWTQLTGYPSPCASNQFVSAYGSTLTCASISLPWSQLTSFPSACPSGQFVSALGSTPTCDVAGPLNSRTTSTQSSNGGTWLATGLSVSVSANTNYAFTANLYYQGGNTVGGTDFDFTVHSLPSGATLVEACMIGLSASNQCINSPGSTLYTTYYVQYGQSAGVQVTGLIKVGSTGGTLSLDWQADPCCYNPGYLLAGSWMVAYQVA